MTLCIYINPLDLVFAHFNEFNQLINRVNKIDLSKDEQKMTTFHKIKQKHT